MLAVPGSHPIATRELSCICRLLQAQQTVPDFDLTAAPSLEQSQVLRQQIGSGYGLLRLSSPKLCKYLASVCTTRDGHDRRAHCIRILRRSNNRRCSAIRLQNLRVDFLQLE